ncbi:TetR/AcrR family transcriptional regulator [Xanthobacter dioxanivorans]|uniref:TetR/AcrR family transcriptional regulator n=1 Tax=Xanthobacter dioxanivorans TaxID=2528964 RepID=A0A974PKQ1_9HYPH|nr:TetR/AcrR family transcriptional regulator [Xanthobacter dioxanivorans]QRG05370.1 TetR/AcrR family transcriptional regulator [Xanthobacter dioxanivorans]
MERAAGRRKAKPEQRGQEARGERDAPAPKRRLSAEDRRQEILTKSIEYFSKVGFGGGTRDLARHLGTTQPLLYRYFPNKDALIQEIYKVVFLDQWKPSWDALLTDRSRPLRARLQDFYEAYTDTILTPLWIRIYFFAGLKGEHINERYITLVEERLLSRIIREFHVEQGLEPPETIGNRDLEIAWNLQSGIFYYGVRKYIYHARTFLPKNEMISCALDLFFGGYAEILAQRRCEARAVAPPPAKPRTRSPRKTGPA